MAEWSNAFDLKSNVVKATEGSNPSLSVNTKAKKWLCHFFAFKTLRKKGYPSGSPSFLLIIRDVQLRIKNQPSLQTAKDEENDG
jgi:hypothetical protein